MLTTQASVHIKIVRYNIALYRICVQTDTVWDREILGMEFSWKNTTKKFLLNCIIESHLFPPTLSPKGYRGQQLCASLHSFQVVWQKGPAMRTVGSDQAACIVKLNFKLRKQPLKGG